MLTPTNGGEIGWTTNEHGQMLLGEVVDRTRVENVIATITRKGLNLEWTAFTHGDPAKKVMRGKAETFDEAMSAVALVVNFGE